MATGRKTPLALGVLVSGGGRSLENLARVIANKELDASIALVVCNDPAAAAIARAQRLGLKLALIESRAYNHTTDFSRAVFAALEQSGCELAVLAGFLRLLEIPTAWEGRVINIHPSLLPAFGGKGFYGMRVHEAVIASKAKVSGCTVHYVNNEYDAGAILLQRQVPVEPSDTAESLASRVFEAEKVALPDAIRIWPG